MNVLVLGATGRTGRRLVALSSLQGHQVTALVRSPDASIGSEPPARVLTGSATDTRAVDEAVSSQDAVLCALGPSSPRDLIACRLMRATTDALVVAMERHGVRRLVLLSALGAGESARQAPVALRLTFGTMLRIVGRDKAESERRLRASSLEWTIVYPPRLTDGPKTEYRHGQTLRLRGAPAVSRAAVAEFMVEELDAGRYLRQGVVLAP
jgi:putative NADH-flavin reductase